MATGSSYFEAFGLVFESELPLPEARPGAPCDADVAVRLGRAPRPAGLATVVDQVAAGPSAFWMDVDAIARYLVRDGREIVVEPCPDAPAHAVRAYLLGSAMGALLLQRGVLPLHASAVRVHGRVVAFMGPSGAGKSTLALGLAARGHEVLCDDICAVTIHDGQATIRPGLRSLRLWPASLLAYRHAPERLGRVLPDAEKRLLPIAPPARPGPSQIELVCTLRASAATTGVRRLQGAAAARAILANTFRGQLVRPMGRSLAHFEQCAALAEQVRAIELARPDDATDMTAWPRLIEDYLAAPAGGDAGPAPSKHRALG